MDNIKQKVISFALVKQLVICILAIALSFAASCPCDSYAETKKEKKEKKLEEVKDEKSDVIEKLNDLSAKIEKKEKSIKKAEKAIRKKNKEIRSTEQSLELMKKQIRKRKNGLDKRVRTMYKNGVIGYLDIILNSNDVTELITNIDMVQKIYEADQETLDTLVEQKIRIEAEEAVLKKEKSELADNKSDLEASKKELDSMNSKLQKEYEKLKAEEEKLESEILAMMDDNKVGRYKGGKWVCPVYGSYSVNSYGDYNAGRSYESHPGVDMAKSTGTPIHAAYKGKVIWAGWYGGYGNAVMINHGSGIVSLYGHNSSVSVSVGETVKRGEVIASMGSTGWSTGPHCHFEVRKYSSESGTGSYHTLDPRKFCNIRRP